MSPRRTGPARTAGRHAREDDRASLAGGGRGLERLVYFSDAVFAIVITLLVLPLAAEFEAPEASASLASEVLNEWPRILSFVVSFLVIGQFWIAHHSMFELVDRFDHALLWLNLGFLLTISFQPFPTAVLGARLEGRDQFPVVFYAASMTMSSIALTAAWLYARRRALTSPATDEVSLTAFTSRAVATSAVFVVSVGLAFTGLLPALLCWVVVMPAVRRFVPRRVTTGWRGTARTVPRQRVPDA